MLHYLTLSEKIVKDKGLVNEINGLNNIWVKYYLLTQNAEKGLSVCETLLAAYKEMHKVTIFGHLRGQEQIFSNGRKETRSSFMLPTVY